MYPRFEESHIAKVLVLPPQLHPYFYSTSPQNWHPNSFARHEDARQLSDFLSGLKTVDRSGSHALATYAGACRKYLVSDEGGQLIMKEAELHLSLRIAHQENGIQESVYAATVKGAFFASESKKFTIKQNTPPSPLERFSRLNKQSSSVLVQGPSKNPRQESGVVEDDSTQDTHAKKRARRGKENKTVIASNRRVEDPWHYLIQKAIVIHSGKKVEIEPQAHQQSHWRSILFERASDMLTKASHDTQNALLLKESLVALSGIWDTYSSQNNKAFGAAATQKVLESCSIPELKAHEPRLQEMLEKFMDLHVQGKSTLDLADYTMDSTLQDKYPDFRNFLHVLRVIFRQVHRPLYGSEHPSEADFVFVWASILREGLPIKTELSISLGEQGCKAAALSKSELAAIFDTGTTARKCDILLKVAGLEVANFEAKGSRATPDDLTVQRLKNTKINKSIQLVLDKYDVTVPPLLNISSHDASLFRLAKFEDIWVTGQAGNTIVLPKTHDEILFFLEDSAYTLYNLIMYLDQYASKVKAARQRYDYQQRKQAQLPQPQRDDQGDLEWERIVFHSPSK
ncbi:hypothetical protein BGX29_010314 [Mortierella sp. GBA35]|nr:hypothetical protein BGX29_010314 [Mortierella sp. GBA35]